MKCTKCGADLTEETKKCPFCKEVLLDEFDGIDGGFDFKYTITSKEQMKLIRDAVNAEHTKKISAFGTLKKALDTKKEKTKKRKKNIIKNLLKKISPQNKMYIIFYGAIFLAILLVLGIWTVAGAVSARKRDVYPVVYSKENSIYMQYEKNNVLLTENAVDLNVLFDESAADSENTDKTTTFGILSSEDTVKKSKNGMYVYFYENYDKEKHSGSLIRIFNGKEKRIVSNDVYNSYVMSEDGEEVLYLQSADKNGDMGNLYYWNEKLKEPIKIAGDIDKESFGFSADGKKIVYLSNYNHKNFSGDLYSVEKGKTDAKALLVDSAVSAFFSTDANGKEYYYSKNYNGENKSYDLYVKGGTKSVRLFEAAVKEPIIPQKGKNVLVYGYDDGLHSILYSVNAKSYEKNKIAQVTEVLKTDSSNKKIIFNKLQENYVTDCYYYEPGKRVMKIADNITVVSRENDGANLFSFSENFEKAAYITSFDNGKSGGKLCVVDLKKSKDNITEVSEEVFSCYMSSDGKKLYYCKDYSKQRQLFDVYSYDGKKSKAVAEDVEGAFFQTTKNRKRAVYLKDSGVEGAFGNLYITDKKDVAKAEYEKTFAFAVCEDESVIILETGGEKNGKLVLSRTNKKGDVKKLIDSEVDGLLCY